MLQFSAEFLSCFVLNQFSDLMLGNECSSCSYQIDLIKKPPHGLTISQLLYLFGMAVAL